MAVNKTKRPTLKTIAYMTGLGVTTVSKALKDAPDIKASTRQRVKLIAEQIGYQPDRTGLRLRTGKTNVICLTMSTEEEVSSMASQFIIGAMQALQNTPYNLVLTPYARADDPMESVRHIVETRAADGVILSQIQSNDKRLAYLDKASMPYATHGRSNMGLNHAYFDFDSEQFAMNAVQLLFDKGCKRVGIVAPPMEYAYARFMREGFDLGLQRWGLEEAPIYNVSLYDSVEQIAESISQMFKQKHGRPDAFICGSVGATIGTIGGVENAGLVVGKDVHIVSKQPPTNLLKWFGRPVHAIEDDFKTAGLGVATSLLKVIEGEPVENHQTVVYPKNWGQLVTELNTPK